MKRVKKMRTMRKMRMMRCMRRRRTVNMLSDEYFQFKTSEILYVNFRLSLNFSLS